MRENRFFRELISKLISLSVLAGYSTIVDEWTQLSNTPTLPEERHKGSPSSPLISLFRLDVVDGTKRITSVLVIFRIVEEVNTYRPWRKADVRISPSLTLLNELNAQSFLFVF